MIDTQRASPVEGEKTAKLKPCPFCGSRFKMSQEPHDNHPVAGKFYIYHEYGPIGSAARKCIIDVPSHFESAEEATEAWNRRAEGRDARKDGA